MATWNNYWRIITPTTRNAAYQRPNSTALDDSMNLNTSGYASFATIAWFSNLMKGATSRLQRYKQYDAMDKGDISRGLDIIAEETSAPDKRTGLPFIIDYQTEEHQDIPETTATTIRAALRHWARHHNLNKKIFNVSRQLVKYGDVFFKKSSDTKKWQFVDPTCVIAIEIDSDQNVLNYHLRPSSFQAVVPSKSKKQEDAIEIVSAAAMVHFTLSDDMGDAAPFGMSILQAAFSDYQKLTMLEDSAIIYRIVRAPERRVFYVDVGNMPPQKVKQYLEQIKNDIRQKRMPNTANQNQTDSTYNPECLALDTKIPLLDGRTLTLSQLIEEHQSGKVNWAYSVCPETGKSAPGIITWAGITRKNAKRIKLTLDNGKDIIVTPDHKFPVQGKGFIEAQYISSNDSLFPFTTQNKVMYGKSDYEQIWDSASNTFIFTHRMVHDFMRSFGEHSIFSYKNDGRILQEVIHHLDYNRFNNTPSNLVLMDAEDHDKFHKETKKEWWDSLSVERKSEVCATLAAGTKAAFANMPEDVKATQIEKATNRIRAYHHANKISPSEKYTDWLSSASARIAALSNLEYIRQFRSQNGKLNCNLPATQHLTVSQDAISRMVEIIKHNDSDRVGTMSLLENDEIFMSIFKSDNAASRWGVSRISGAKITDKYLKKAYSFVGVKDWKELKQAAHNYNHKVVSMTEVEDADVGTITIDGTEKFHNYHTFALEAGVYTKNSIQEDYFFPVTGSGRGSRVETLPGGANWEIPELEYFMNKVFRALRVPMSYMRGQEANGGQYNDGKVGVAYMEERIFANFIMRIQAVIEDVFDLEFKTYLMTTGINVDTEIFKLVLPEPQNFAMYRQAALDSDLISSFKSIEETGYMSKRFMLERYLGLTKDDIARNEALLKQERGILDDVEMNVTDVQQIYDPQVFDSRDKIEVVPKAEAEKDRPSKKTAKDEDTESEE